MTLTEIALRIQTHLRRIEKDPPLNPSRACGLLFYNASARRAGSYVHVSFVSYQPGKNLAKPDAEAYLSWLDAGNAGTYYAFSHERERELVPDAAPTRATPGSSKCQFCGRLAPAKEWKRNRCPRCGAAYDAASHASSGAQEGDDG